MYNATTPTLVELKSTDKHAKSIHLKQSESAGISLP